MTDQTQRLLPGERAFFEALRAIWPDASLWRNREIDGAVYALLTQNHGTHTGAENGWNFDRALYVNLSTRLTFDRDANKHALSFAKRFVPFIEEG